MAERAQELDNLQIILGRQRADQLDGFPRQRGQNLKGSANAAVGAIKPLEIAGFQFSAKMQLLHLAAGGELDRGCEGIGQFVHEDFSIKKGAVRLLGKEPCGLGVVQKIRLKFFEPDLAGLHQQPVGFIENEPLGAALDIEAFGPQNHTAVAAEMQAMLGVQSRRRRIVLVGV